LIVHLVKLQDRRLKLDATSLLAVMGTIKSFLSALVLLFTHHIFPMRGDSEFWAGGAY